jgi:hypothetical protein
MIRIFYDEISGVIHSSTTAAFASSSELPYIDIEQQVRICDWRVNPQTRTLEAITPAQPTDIVPGR